MEVQVTFLMEADEPGHKMGLSEYRYGTVFSAITSLGGYDIEFEKFEYLGRVIDDNAPRPKKAK